ncbi:MAG: flavoprotein [Desulfurococcaceae archaeon]
MTGAGALLEESVKVIEELVIRGIKITAFVSKAGETVLEMYGLRGKLENALVGDYPTGIIYESSEPPGFPSTGRLYLGTYSRVIVSPATMNTVSKIVNGVADSLVSTLAMHALKTRTPLYILPVDAYEVKSTVPLVIDRERCRPCNLCYAANACPTGALREHPYYKVAVNVIKCNRCYACLAACPHGAVKFNVEIVVKPAPFYLEIVKKLQSITGVTVLSRPEQVKELLGVTA